MIRRYRNGGALLFIETEVFSNNETGSDSHSVTFSTQVTGEPGSVVTFKVTTYTASPGATPNYTVDGTSYVLNNTFTRTLDGSGQVTFVQYVDVGAGSASGNALDVILTIESTTIGPINTLQDSTNISKTIT
jgi:hypothetical protein